MHTIPDKNNTRHTLIVELKREPRVEIRIDGDWRAIGKRDNRAYYTQFAAKLLKIFLPAKIISLNLQFF